MSYITIVLQNSRLMKSEKSRSASLIYLESQGRHPIYLFFSHLNQSLLNIKLLDNWQLFQTFWFKQLLWHDYNCIYGFWWGFITWINILVYFPIFLPIYKWFWLYNLVLFQTVHETRKQIWKRKLCRNVLPLARKIELIYKYVLMHTLKWVIEDGYKLTRKK